MICRTCDSEFEKKTIKRGYINQCNSCSLKQNEPLKFLGRQGLSNKSSSIVVITTGLKEMKRFIQFENMRGPGVTLNMSSIINEHVRQSEQEELDRS